MQSAQRDAACSGRGRIRCRRFGSSPFPRSPTTRPPSGTATYNGSLKWPGFDYSDVDSSAYQASMTPDITKSPLVARGTLGTTNHHVGHHQLPRWAPPPPRLPLLPPLPPLPPLTDKPSPDRHAAPPSQRPKAPPPDSPVPPLHTPTAPLHPPTIPPSHPSYHLPTPLGTPNRGGYKNIPENVVELPKMRTTDDLPY